MYIPVKRRAVESLLPAPSQVAPHIVDWLELIGTWGLVVLVGVGVWFDWQFYKRGNSPSWQRED